MASEREEVIVEADLIDAEQFLPPASECRLNTLRCRNGSGLGRRLTRRRWSAAFDCFERLRKDNDRGGRVRKQDARERSRALNR